MLACYLRLIRAGFRRYSTYRQAVIAGLATNIVFGFMRCAVLLTVFAGTLDALLLRPLPALTQICASDFALRRVGKVGTALAVLGYVLVTSDISWTPLRVAVLLITPLTGLVLLGAIWVAASATTFWLVEGQELHPVLQYSAPLMAVLAAGAAALVWRAGVRHYVGTGS